MTKADEYLGDREIIAISGKVWTVDEFGFLYVIGEIERIEVSIEYPEEMLGICRVAHIMLFGEDDEELYEDQGIVDNAEYHSEDDLLDAVAKHYGVSRTIIDTIS